MNFKIYPKGYRLIETMDFVRNRKQMLTVCIASLIAVAVMLIVGLIFYPISPSWNFLKTHWWAWLALAGMLAAYIPLHELVHGMLMFALSGIPPKYGFQLCYAYAGSRAFFDRTSHNIIALAPVVFFGIVLFVLERCLPSEWFWLLYAVQISNISGSVGDIYCVLHLKNLPKDIVIHDSGTRMCVYAPAVQAAQFKRKNVFSHNVPSAQIPSSTPNEE